MSLIYTHTLYASRLHSNNNRKLFLTTEIRPNKAVEMYAHFAGPPFAPLTPVLGLLPVSLHDACWRRPISAGNPGCIIRVNVVGTSMTLRGRSQANTTSTLGPFDPKIFSQLYRMHDPRVFNSDDLHLMMFRNYPIVNSELMESSVNFWGDEIRISPMERFVGAKRSDTASKFILDNKLRLIPQYREEVIDRSVNPPVTRPMTDHEFRWYVVKSGKSFRDWVEANRVRLAKKNHDAMETEVQDAFNNIKRHWKRLALDKIARNVPLEYD